jgi:hypothetical protein
VADHFRPEVYWFITTRDMEEQGKTICIKQALRMKGNALSDDICKIEEVDQNSLVDCIEKLERMVESTGDDNNYIVNITGGNKMMALGALEVFSNVGQKVRIGYMPLGENNFIQIYPKKRPFKITPLSPRLSLEEYLICYGFIIDNKKRLTEVVHGARRRKEISEWMLNHYEKLKGVLGFLYRHLGERRSEKVYNFAEEFKERHLAPIENEFLSKLAFHIDGPIIRKELRKDEIHYVTGGWLEEYVFWVIEELVKRQMLDDALMSVQIKSSRSKSELDTAFMKDNSFYHIECKTLGEKDERNLIRDEIYKKSALTTLLGKGKKRAMICTTLPEIKGHIISRAKDYDIEVFNIGEVRNLLQTLRSRFGISNG